jgi:parallel beta-helix repeat protein
MRTALTLLGMVLSISTAFSATIYVPDNYSRIQDAIDASVNGDTVIVRPGTYQENIDFLGKAITVKGEKGALFTTIDGRQIGSVAVFMSGETATSVLKGFSIINGSGTSHGGTLCGGGIYCSASSPTVSNNTIAGSTAYRGGGIFCFSSSPTISNNDVTGNWASDVGGGISCQDQSSPPITGNTIAGNTAAFGGGIDCGASSNPTIANNDIRGNTASGSFVMGGGIYCDDSSPNIVNNFIAGNTVVGTIHAFGGGLAFYTFSSPTITNNTVVGNVVSAAGPAYGGAMLCHQSFPVIANSIFYDNIASAAPAFCILDTTAPSVVTIDYSDVEGGLSYCIVDPGCTLNWGPDMIETDPLFVDTGSGDFHITWNSPCRNTGDNAAVSIQLDFEGDPRITLGTVDMGADEFYFHLYRIGDVLPGAPIDIKVVGIPGLSALLALGNSIQDPPQSTPHGYLWLTMPLAKSWQLGAIPNTGILAMPATVPSGWPIGSRHPFQALVGPWGGGATRLTNLLLLEVE